MKSIELDWVEIREEKKACRISLKDRRLFFATLARLLQGGVSILRALEIVPGETRKEALRGLISRIGAEIREGKSLSYGLSLYPEAFPLYEVRLVQAGEASGQMDRVLEDMARGLEKEEETRAKVREAVAYPAFLIIFGLLTVFVLTAFIIPRLAAVYEDFGEKLPWMTRLVIQISQGMKFMIPVFFALSVAAYFLIKKSVQKGTGSEILPVPFVALRIPLFGDMVRNLLLIRLSYLLSLLLKSGIPLLRALEAVGGQDKAAERVAGGESLAESLRGLPFVNETSLALILAGEESGTLAESLEEISQVYSRELESSTRMILKLLEPALILVIGGVTGLVVIAMIFPIVTLSAVVR